MYVELYVFSPIYLHGVMPKNWQIRPYLCFVNGLFNEAFSSSNERVEWWDGLWIIHWIECERKCSWPNLEYYQGICLEGQENLSQDSQSPGRHLNPGLSRLQTRYTIPHPWHSMLYLILYIRNYSFPWWYLGNRSPVVFNFPDGIFWNRIIQDWKGGTPWCTQNYLLFNLLSSYKNGNDEMQFRENLVSYFNNILKLSNT
jgi:hypothetical protein